MKKIAVLMMIPVLLLSVSCRSKQDPDTVYFNDEADMKSLDPQIMTDHSAIELAGSLWEGLTRVGKNGEVVPGVAEKWTVSGNVWTFTLRENAKWSDGTTVKADDFVLGIRRACDPETAAEYSYMVFYIKNAEAFNQKKITDPALIGVKAVDARTLRIELEKPTPFFASLLSFPTYFPVPADFYKKYKNDFALKADRMLYNGPWKISKWLPSDRVDLMKNDQYWNRDQIRINKIAYLFVKDTNTMVNMYKNSQLDLTMVAGDKVNQFKGTPDLQGFQEGTIVYFEYNVRNKILANKKIRKAFSLAINREEYVERIVQGGAVPAYYLVPSIIPGNRTSFRKESGEKLFSSDAAEAKKLFAEGLKEIGHSGPVEVKLLTDDNDRAVKSAQYLQESLRSVLGVTLTPETLTFQIRLQRQQSHDFDMTMMLWGPDYMDPLTYLDLFVTNGGNNHGGWSNTQYDAFIRTAQISGDNSVRMNAMAKAEKLLIDEMAIAPLYVRYRNYVLKSRLKGVIKRPFGQETDFYWAYLENPGK
jgi:oligopeptide transport system substrate-binding protein